MNKERELDNLNIMRENGLITEQTYQAQRRALLGTSAGGIYSNGNKRLKSLSLLDAYKFSFGPATFGANFIFVFSIVMMILAAVGIFIMFAENIFMSFVMDTKSFEHNTLAIMIAITLFAYLWESFFITFFSRLSFEKLNRECPPFQLKNFVLKSLSLFGIFTVFSAIYFGIVTGLEFIKIWLEVQSFEPWQRYTFAICLIILLVGIVLGLAYLLIAFSTACIGPLRNWGKTALKALKSPLLIVFAGACLLFNGVVMFVLGKIYEYAEKSIDKMVKSVIETIMDISGGSLFGIYALLGIVLFFVYASASRYVRFLIKISFLFVIPSALILWGILSQFPFLPSLPTSVYFAYFLMMHFIWFVFYCLFFFIVQGMAFFAHVITQVWCHLTHDNHGNYLYQTSEKQTQKLASESKYEYEPPAVFR